MKLFLLVTLAVSLTSGSINASDPTPQELIGLATTGSGEHYPVLPSLSTRMRGNIAIEIENSKAIRDAYTLMNAKDRRNTDWFEGIVQLEKAEASWSLQSCLCHPSEDVQIRALESLGRLGDKQALPFLLIFSDYMAVPEMGSENATIHGIIHESIAKACSALTGIEITLEGQDSEGLKRANRKWAKRLLEYE